MKDDLHMLDGRKYITTDGWKTIKRVLPDGKTRLVTDEEADLVRYLSMIQAGSTRNENIRKGKGHA